MARDGRCADRPVAPRSRRCPAGDRKRTQTPAVRRRARAFSFPGKLPVGWSWRLKARRRCQPPRRGAHDPGYPSGMTDTVGTATSWRSHLIDRDEDIRALLSATHRIAVLGIKTEETGQPAY